MIKLVAFDGDDTLWHNEPLYAETASRFRELLASYHPAEWVDERLYRTEVKNLRHYGYGIKSFILSMIETAIELTESRITGAEIGEILGFAKAMLEAPVRLLDGAEEAVSQLADSYRLVIVTKGDLFDQESKIARSGLGDYFNDVEIVSDKNEATYREIAVRNGVDLGEFVMVGDSIRSDILPVVEAGGHAIHVPYSTPWQYEVVPEEVSRCYQYLRADSILAVPSLIRSLCAS